MSKLNPPGTPHATGRRSFRNVKVEDPPAPFIKHDTDKTNMALVDPNFVKGIGDVMTMGAKKYSPDNWKGGTVERYMSALERHMLAFKSGENNDPESGLSHMCHVACCAMMVNWFIQTGLVQKDDRRYKPDTSFIPLTEKSFLDGSGEMRDIT